jgi:hypothetical protein
MTQRSTDAGMAAEDLAPGGDREAQSDDDPRAEDRGAFGDLRAVPSPGGTRDSQDDALRESDSEGEDETFHRRLDRLEKQNFRMKLAVIVLMMIVGYLSFGEIISENTIVRQTLMESRELKLLDNNGNARLFLRMYSRVPVLQLLDSGGKPRLSLGMRFDDTPFIDLSDKNGRTRATLELTEKDEPTLRMFDENGDPTFKIR